MSMTQTADTHEKGITGRTVLMLATGAGFSVASIYYSQPMLGILVNELHAGVSTVGLVPTLTQIGYALGILLLAPLGDRHDRRQIIVLKGVLLTAALLLSAFSGGISMLLIASLAWASRRRWHRISFRPPPAFACGTAWQNGRHGDDRPAAGHFAIPGVERFRRGVLRLAEHVWRGGGDGGGNYAGDLAQPAAIPASTTMSYPALLASMRHLWTEYKPLRRATLAQALLSVGFSAFWSTLAVMLHDVYQLGSATAGMFGLAGAAGALAAPLAGSLADRRGPELVTRIGTGLATVSFALMFLLPLLPAPFQLALIVISAIGFDFGVQSTLVSHQSIIFSLEPAARSRLNALMFTGVFIGMAAGSALGI